GEGGDGGEGPAHSAVSRATPVPWFCPDPAQILRAVREGDAGFSRGQGASWWTRSMPKTCPWAWQVAQLSAPRAVVMTSAWAAVGAESWQEMQAAVSGGRSVVAVTTRVLQ